MPLNGGLGPSRKMLEAIVSPPKRLPQPYSPPDVGEALSQATTQIPLEHQLVAMGRKQVAATPPNYGPRYGTNTPKGLGYFGPIQMPDNSVRGEFSVGTNVNGKEMEIPSMVPTLTRDELNAVLKMQPGDAWSHEILQKAINHARQRLATGQDPFAGPGEQQNLYPDFKRAPIPRIIR